MAVKGKVIIDTVVAGLDLSSHQYKFCTVNGSLAIENDLAHGVLQNKPLSGQHASLAVSGMTKVKAGGAITKGARFKAGTGGVAFAVASGDGAAVGISRDTVNSGDTFSAIVDCANAATTFNSL